MKIVLTVNLFNEQMFFNPSSLLGSSPPPPPPTDAAHTETDTEFRAKPSFGQLFWPSKLQTVQKASCSECNIPSFSALWREFQRVLLTPLIRQFSFKWACFASTHFFPHVFQDCGFFIDRRSPRGVGAWTRALSSSWLCCWWLLAPLAALFWALCGARLSRYHLPPHHPTALSDAC